VGRDGTRLGRRGALTRGTVAHVGRTAYSSGVFDSLRCAVEVGRFDALRHDALSGSDVSA